MNQSGNTIQNANLQEFLDSAANATAAGQRQFYTPEAIAAALFRPLPAIRKAMLADLHFGNGSLAAASGADTAIGLDIDARIKSSLKPHHYSPQSSIGNPSWHVEQADLTRWYPLAAEAGLKLPFITLNPPFSLQWYSDRLAPLADSTIPEVKSAFRQQGKHIDSTLASFLIALDLLGSMGEGFMVCNANTARRFFGDPENVAAVCDRRTSPPAADLMRYIYLWLEIPTMIFDNQMSDFPTAVLYFSRSPTPSPSPLFLRTATGTPAAIDSALMVPEVFTAHRGSRYRYEHEFGPRSILEKFSAITKEYGQRFKSHKPEWNIMLDDKGRLRTHLTPFQAVSKRLHPQTVQHLHELNLQTPVALCVTATSRTVLRDAVDSGIWRIHPAVHQAITKAVADFDSEGAPFYTPSPVQSLGWVDEHSALTCKQAGIGSAKPGDSCPISCTVEPTEWKDMKINLAGDTEELKYTGKELLVCLTDPSGCEHHFHVRRDEKHSAPETHNGKVIRLHWEVSDLIEHFHIPIPKDIVTLNPHRYQSHLATLDLLEQRINQNLAKAS